MTDLLSDAKMVGHQPDHPPLTEADIHLVVGRFYSRAWAAVALDPRHPEDRRRPTTKGNAGRRGDLWLNARSDRRGIWALLSGYHPGTWDVAWTRSGHIPWSTAETALAALWPDLAARPVPGVQLDLFGAAL